MQLYLCHFECVSDLHLFRSGPIHSCVHFLQKLVLWVTECCKQQPQLSLRNRQRGKCIWERKSEGEKKIYWLKKQRYKQHIPGKQWLPAACLSWCHISVPALCPAASFSLPNHLTLPQPKHFLHFLHPIAALFLRAHPDIYTPPRWHSLPPYSNTEESREESQRVSMFLITKIV